MPETHRHAAIMFTDIVGYTRLMGSDEEKAVDMLSRNRTIHQSCIEKFNGTLIKEIGDGILASFSLASEAVRCAMEIQKGCKERGIPLRIGIHEGEMIFSGSDVIGDGVNIASRLQEDAQEGCISISDTVYRDIKNKTGLKAISIDEKKFKNVDDPIKVYRIYSDEYEGEKISKIPTKEKTFNSIAVLPFVNMSNDPEQEYFCDGMSEEIINALSHIESLKVIARTSAFKFKGKVKDMREIGRKLDVMTLLEGSVRKAGNRVRISVQLINASDGSHLWSDAYNRELEDVFAIQEEISFAIVKNLKIKLLGEEKKAIVKRHTENMEAYNLYLKGRYYRQMYTAHGFKKAIESFEQSLQKDPNLAIAYVGLSDVYATMSIWGNLAPNKAYPIAKEYVKKALEIDNTLAEAHCALGGIYMMYDWDWNAAEEELKNALQLNLNSSIAHKSYSWFLTITNRHDEAIEEARLAQMLDPLSSHTNTSLGQAYFHAGQYDKAIEIQKMIIEINTNFIPAHINLALAYGGKFMIKEATEEIEKVVNLSMDAPMVMSALANGYLETGKKVMAQKLIDNLIQRSKNEYVPASCFFHYHLLQCDFDQAFICLKRAVDEHDSFLSTWILNPIERYSIPNEPRFNKLIKNVGLERNRILAH